MKRETPSTIFWCFLVEFLQLNLAANSPVEFQAPASEFLSKPATWRIALEDPMALQATVIGGAGVMLLVFLGTFLSIEASRWGRLLPLVIALVAFVATAIFFFLRRRRMILLAFERGFLVRAQVLKTRWLYTQQPIELLYSSDGREIPATGLLAWGSNHRRLRREGFAWVVVDPLRPGTAYFVEPLGVKVPSHLAAYVQMPYSQGSERVSLSLTETRE